MSLIGICETEISIEKMTKILAMPPFNIKRVEYCLNLSRYLIEEETEEMYYF